MRPGRRTKDEIHRLPILDLDRLDLDSRGRGDRLGRVDRERRHRCSRMRGGSGDDGRGILGLARRDGDGVLRHLDPEGGIHLDGICIRAGLSCSRRSRGRAEEKGDVAGPPTYVGSHLRRGDVEGAGPQDILPLEVVAQHQGRVVEDVLRNGTRGDKGAQVDRQAVLAGRGRDLAGLRLKLGRVAGGEGGDIMGRDVWRTADDVDRFKALSVDGGSVGDGSHAHQRIAERRVRRRWDVHPKPGFDVDLGGFFIS